MRGSFFFLLTILFMPIAAAAGEAAAQSSASASTAGEAPRFVAMLDDPLPSARAEGALALIRMGDAALPAVIAALAEQDRPAPAAPAAGPAAAIRTDNPDAEEEEDEEDSLVLLAWVLVHSDGASGQAVTQWLRTARRLTPVPGEPEARAISSLALVRAEVLAPRSRVDALPLVRLVLRQRREEALALIPAMLDNPDPAWRTLGLLIAGDLGEGGTPLLERIAAMAGTAQGAERIAAVRAVAEMGEAGRRTSLDWLDAHADAGVRIAVASHIDPGTEIAPALWRALRDSNPQVREAAAGSFGQIERLPPEMTEQVLRQVFRDVESDAAGDLLRAIDPGDSALARHVPRLARLLVPASQEENFALFEAAATLLAAQPAASGAGQALAEAAQTLVRSDRIDDAVAILGAMQGAAEPTELDDALLQQIWRQTPAEDRLDRGRELIGLGGDRPWIRAALIEEIRRRPADEENAGFIALLAMLGEGALADLFRAIPAAAADAPHCAALWELASEAARDQRTLEIWLTVSRGFERGCRAPVLAAAPPLTDSQIEQLARDGGAEGAGEEAARALAFQTLFAPDASERMLAWLRDTRLPATAILPLVCHLVATGAIEPQAARAALAARPFADLGEIPQVCIALADDPDFGRLVARRLDREGDEFARWAGEDEGGSSHLLEIAALRFPSDPLPAEELAMLVRLSGHANIEIAEWAVQALGRSGSSDEAVRATLARAAARPSLRVAEAAAEAMLAVDPSEAAWDRAAAILVRRGADREIREFARNEGGELRIRSAEYGEVILVTSSMRVPALPAFPWPPPRYAHRLVFGDDLPRSLLGPPNATLGSAHQKLIRALRQVSPGFERGLFRVPGGFALLTRLEQTDAEGRPLPGSARWLSVRTPPQSLGDYVSRLFLAPPGYYRAIVFLFTTQPNFQVSNARLPDIRQGGAALPPELASKPLSSVSAMALIYSFTRRDGGYPRLFTDLDGPVHLDRSGLTRNLQSQ